MRNRTVVMIICVLLVGVFSGYALSAGVGWQHKDSFTPEGLGGHLSRSCDPDGNLVYVVAAGYGVSVFVLSKNQSGYDCRGSR